MGVGPSPLSPSLVRPCQVHSAQGWAVWRPPARCGSAYHEAVYLFARTLEEKLACLIIVALREEEWYWHFGRGGGPLDAYHDIVFHIPAPREAGRANALRVKTPGGSRSTHRAFLYQGIRFVAGWVRFWRIHARVDKQHVTMC